MSRDWRNTYPTATGVLETPMGEDEGIDFEIIELLFFAYRDFISDPDAILDTSGFGRAHHRVVHFVNREPGLTVAALLDTLKITKQSLARVLKQLIDSGYIEQVAGPEDRRQRRLFPTQRGRELALALARPQSRRIARCTWKSGCRMAGQRSHIPFGDDQSGRASAGEG
jgi:DNA-binding MarR family transcriptional regulator